jgi:hypothetical protein
MSRVYKVARVQGLGLKLQTKGRGSKKRELHLQQLAVRVQRRSDFARVVRHGCGEGQCGGETPHATVLT